MIKYETVFTMRNTIIKEVKSNYDVIIIAGSGINIQIIFLKGGKCQVVSKWWKL